jgi:hypothetical protein
MFKEKLVFNSYQEWNYDIYEGLFSSYDELILPGVNRLISDSLYKQIVQELNDLFLTNVDDYYPREYVLFLYSVKSSIKYLTVKNLLTELGMEELYMVIYIYVCSGKLDINKIDKLVVYVEEIVDNEIYYNNDEFVDLSDSVLWAIPIIDKFIDFKLSDVSKLNNTIPDNTEKDEFGVMGSKIDYNINDEDLF